MKKATVKIAVLVAAGLCLLALPLVTGRYVLYLLNLAAIFSIAIMGLNILMGLGGQMFFGPVAMMALGAYSTASFIIYLKMPSLLSIVLAGFATGLLSLVIILPALRLRGLYLAMVSVGFHLILEQVIGGWSSFTGGYDGLSLPGSTAWGLKLTADKNFYYIALFSLLVLFLLGRNLLRTRVGRAIWSIGQDPVAASVIGIDIVFYKTVAFLICAFYCGVAGGLLAFYLQFITPDHFTLTSAIMLLVGMIIGGWGSLPGSIVGGFFVTFLPELVSLFKDSFLGPETALFDLEAAVSGIIIVMVVIFVPNGISPWVTGLRTRWQRTPVHNYSNGKGGS